MSMWSLLGEKLSPISAASVASICIYSVNNEIPRLFAPAQRDSTRVALPFFADTCSVQRRQRLEGVVFIKKRETK